MSITYFEINTYKRYQVRITRHEKQYSKTFNCVDGKQKAYKKAKKYEKALLKYLNVAPLTSAGRRKNRIPGTLFLPRIEIDQRYNTIYIAVSYRRKDGIWKKVSRAISVHGMDKAKRLAIKIAKERHIPHPNYVKRRKMPSKMEVQLNLS